jgi:PIN domain nuclease of toxin-antitoxin system
VILLDTHVWVWWVQNDPRMGAASSTLDAAPHSDVAVSAVSCWEVAALHARGRLVFDCSLDEWLEAALRDAAVSVVNLTPGIAVESERLPGELHRDPADRMLIATARTLDCGLLTADQKILTYKHVDAFDLRDLVRRGTRSR